MYNKILVAVDGSIYSDYAIDAAIKLANNNKTTIFGCHIYSSKMHKRRFEDMEKGLPEKYQSEEKLTYLRNTHEDLIGDGMNLISDSYIKPLGSLSNEKGIIIKQLISEGRNYVELIKAIKENDVDLVIVGAEGHGKIPESNIGSLTERVLLHCKDCDILLMRVPLNFKGRPIIVGIDDSQNSFYAFKKALDISNSLEASIEAVSVYDPYFHTGVFNSISKALPEKDKKRFNFQAQEKLHDEIIDKGLEKLYREGLKKAVMIAESNKKQINTQVLTGKVFAKLHHYAALKESGLISVGRWGRHKEEISIIGSNTLSLCRLSTTNVLVVALADNELKIPVLETDSSSRLPWDKDAESILERIPPFARNMAVKAMEDRAVQKGSDKVTVEIVKEVSEIIGMGNGPSGPKNTEAETYKEAELVVLKKIKVMAPDFHKHIAVSKLIGEVVNKGDKVLVYRVEETMPDGPVKIVNKTQLEFR
jgi:nucleotide-binding universal stress UspA family protein